MIIPSKLPLLHHGREIIVHSKCILDHPANLFIRQMVFVGNVQKSPIACHLDDLDLSFEFVCTDPALAGIKKSI